MGMGPIFECPESLISQLPALASSIGVRVGATDGMELNCSTSCYVFRNRFGTIEGHVSVRHDGNYPHQIWLCFPRKHAFNPLRWPADFRLVDKIEQILASNGAIRSFGD